MVSMVLMVALTSGPARMDFHFHKGYGPATQPAYCHPTCYSSCCAYAAGPGCYTGCCSYASCCHYSHCCGGYAVSPGCCSAGNHGGSYGVTSIPGGDVVNANGGWGYPYASYAPLGDIHLNNVAPMAGTAPLAPATQDKSNPTPMKKVDDKNSDAKDGDGKSTDSKNSDGLNRDSKGSDKKNSDGKSAPEKEDSLKNESKKNQSRAKVIVRMPENSKLYIDDQLVKTSSNQKTFSTPGLIQGETYYYEIRIEVVKDGESIVETRKVNIQAGSVARVDFRDVEKTTTVKAK